MNENKTTKYFKYAIGEIVLVVIGILIALQINNWNENRKILKQQVVLYKQLLSDLKADSIFFIDRLRGLSIPRNTFEATKKFEENPSFNIASINTNGEGSVLVFGSIRHSSNIFDNNEDIYSRLIDREVKESLRKYRSVYGYVLSSYQGLNNKLREVSNSVNSRYYKELRANKRDSSESTLKIIYSDKYLRSNADRVLDLINTSEKRTKEFIQQNKKLSLEIKRALKND